jgi:hypothetical protein
MKCCSNCDQGRKKCPTPTSCCMADDEEDDLTCARGIIQAVTWCVIAFAVVLLIYVRFL